MENKLALKTLNVKPRVDWRSRVALGTPTALYPSKKQTKRKPTEKQNKNSYVCS